MHHPERTGVKGRRSRRGGERVGPAPRATWLCAAAVARRQPDAVWGSLQPVAWDWAPGGGGEERSTATAGKLDAGGVEDDEEEEITADSLRFRPRPLPLSALSSFYIPLRRQDPKEHSYFSRLSQTGIVSLYDCIFKRDPGYNQKLHRDDREHAKGLGLHINEEEQERPVGVLMSSVYGKRIHQPVEPLNLEHGRANHLKADFNRKNEIPGFKDPGFGHISPV